MDSSLSGKKVAIIVANYFEQAELTGPRDALKEAGADVTIVSPESEVQGMNGDVNPGDMFTVDMALDDLNQLEYDALIVPGGVVNADKLRAMPRAQELIRTFMLANKPVAVICHGPWLLVDAELANERKLTSFPTLKKDLENAGAIWYDQEVVVDGNLITSRNPDDIPAFNAAIIEQLSGTPIADVIS